MPPMIGFSGASLCDIMRIHPMSEPYMTRRVQAAWLAAAKDLGESDGDDAHPRDLGSEKPDIDGVRCKDR